MRVVLTGLDDEALVLPVVKVLRGIRPDAPGPDTVPGFREFLVLTIEIVGCIFLVVENAPAVRLNALPFRVVKRLAGADAVVTPVFSGDSGSIRGTSRFM